MTNELLRALPSIERMLAGRQAASLFAELGRDRVRDILREILGDIRVEIASGGWSQSSPGARALTAGEVELEVDRRLAERADKARTPSLRRVVNATGVIIHTNLGRAPLAGAAIEALADLAGHYSNLEYDIEKGERGRREIHCQALIARLSGAEAAIVTNNNAAAVMLVLNTIADGGEVIVSRGELIEIGGSFRVPDVMEKSGAKLREVGTTNRTRISDYENAINENTRMILRVHPSNYKIIGFTSRPTCGEIANLAQRAGIPSFEDLGSGCLLDLAPYGVPDEPVVAESLKAGISVVSFSGDKMLGGPQAGVIAGSGEILDRVRKNPLMRALRVDKMTYSALEATLRLYDRGAAVSEVPVIRAIAATTGEIAERAAGFKDMIESRSAFAAELRSGNSVIGGGSAPGAVLKTVLVVIHHKSMSADKIEGFLRAHKTPVISRVEDGRVVIDLRTVAPDEEAIIIDALVSAAGETTAFNARQ